MEPTLNHELAQFIAMQVERQVADRLARLQMDGEEPDIPAPTEWISVQHAREAGDIKIPEYLKELFTADSMETLYSRASVAKFLEKHPEPQGGFLKAQLIDTQLHVSYDARKRDEPLFEAQRATLCIIRPLITLATQIHTWAEEGEERDAFLETIKDTIRYVQHVSSTLRVHRRRTVAGANGLVPSSESHHRIGSSDDSQLFGPELRAALEVEARSQAKQRTLEIIRPKGKPLSHGNGPQGGRGQGRRGPQSFSYQKRSNSKGPIPKAQSSNPTQH